MKCRRGDRERAGAGVFFKKRVSFVPLHGGRIRLSSQSVETGWLTLTVGIFFFFFPVATWLKIDLHGNAMHPTR